MYNNKNKNMIKNYFNSNFKFLKLFKIIIYSYKSNLIPINQMTNVILKLQQKKIQILSKKHNNKSNNYLIRIQLKKIISKANNKFHKLKRFKKKQFKFKKNYKG